MTSKIGFGPLISSRKLQQGSRAWLSGSNFKVLSYTMMRCMIAQFHWLNQDLLEKPRTALAQDVEVGQPKPVLDVPPIFKTKRSQSQAKTLKVERDNAALKEKQERCIDVSIYDEYHKFSKSSQCPDNLDNHDLSARIINAMYFM